MISLPLLVTTFLLFAAFLLLLLVSLSVPIIKTIYLLKLVVDPTGSFIAASGNLRAGVWGYCHSELRASFGPTGLSVPSDCTKAKLGYTINNVVARALGLEDDLNRISNVITAVLILHPIACGFAFVALVISLIAARPSRGTTRLSTLLTIFSTLLAAIITTAVFVVDIVLVATVRSKVKDETDDVDPKWGNAVWMTLGAMVALWLSILFSACGLFQIRRQKRQANTTATY
jgi:multisubunit Na+/H+ antiporter MnhC subunit